MHARELTVDMPYGGEVLPSSTAVGGCIQLPATGQLKQTSNRQTQQSTQAGTETHQYFLRIKKYHEQSASPCSVLIGTKPRNERVDAVLVIILFSSFSLVRLDLTGPVR